MASAPALWIVAICLVTLADPIALGPGCSQLVGVHHMSTAYSILGSATLMYRRLAYLGVMPQVGRVSRLICAVHLAPFSIAYACCAFQFRFLSMSTPRYFVLSAGWIVLCGKSNVGLSVSLHLGTKFSIAAFEYSSGELWVLDQSPTPSSLHIISSSLLWAPVKSTSVAIMIVSSTYAIASSPSRLGMSRRSAL